MVRVIGVAGDAVYKAPCTLRYTVCIGRGRIEMERIIVCIKIVNTIALGINIPFIRNSRSSTGTKKYGPISSLGYTGHKSPTVVLQPCPGIGSIGRFPNSATSSANVNGLTCNIAFINQYGGYATGNIIGTGILPGESYLSRAYTRE